MGGTHIEAYQELANAIVAQAARDYLFILRLLKHHPANSEAWRKAREYERFFHSDWYSTLTNVDPDYLVSRLKKTVGIETEKRRSG